MTTVAMPQSVCFRHWMRAVREGSKMTQEELGSCIGLTGDKISKIESGTRRVLLDEAFAIAVALEVDLQLLIQPLCLPPSDPAATTTNEHATGHQAHH